jgi:hypothetical protein
VTNDPYNLEFLTLAAPVAERDLEHALVAQVELGAGFAFVAVRAPRARRRRVLHRPVDMPHPDRTSYVVVELKTTTITPADVGQLNFYVAAVEGELRLPRHSPTIGLLLCPTRNERTVRYALSITTRRWSPPATGTTNRSARRAWRSVAGERPRRATQAPPPLQTTRAGTGSP